MTTGGNSMKKLFFVLICTLFLTGLLAAETLTLEKVGTYKTGDQPKQVIFSPDNRFMVLPLLDDKGFRVISAEDASDSRIVEPPDAELLGFAEGLFVPEKNAFFVSQMTTGNIYEYSYPGFEYKRTISTGGEWSKFIAWSPEKNLLAVSNWLSNDVSLIDYDSGEVLRYLKTGAAPRGMAFLKGGEEIIVACYDGGQVQKFSVSDGKKLLEYKLDKACMRHLVLSGDEKKFYVSDMFHFTVHEMNTSNFAITRTWKVYNNPNTICLLNDRYLFVSSRGPNNPKDYTLRSPKNGVITVFDVTTGTEVFKVEGGNQPTGLDVSKDGRYLCSSNFQDANCDLYEIKITQD